MEKTSCLIIFESTMKHRYGQMAKIHGFCVYEVGLNNNLGKGFVDTIKQRLRSKKLLGQRKTALIQFLKANNFKEIYLSTAEGYISKNFILILKKQFPHIVINALQHGVFPLKQSILKEGIRNFINFFFHSLTGIYPLGAGFGGVRLDKYYVYTQREKDFLTLEKGWNPNNVIVDIKFIKAELYASFLSFKKTMHQDPETAIFLLQGLNLAGVCSLEDEILLIRETLKFLSLKYKRVLLKEHPACQGRLQKLDLPENVQEEVNMLEGFAKAKHAYSFFSTALVDAKVFNLTTIGIISKKIHIHKQIYDNFDVNIHFEETIAS